MTTCPWDGGEWCPGLCLLTAVRGSFPFAHSPLLGCWVQCRAPSMETLERVQGRTSEKIKGLEHLSDEEGQRAGAGWTREGSRDLITLLEGRCGEDRARLSSVLPSARARWHSPSPTASSDHQGAFFHWEGSAGTGCPGRCCSPRPLRHQKPPGQGPGQPCWSRGLGDDFWRSLPFSAPAVRFCLLCT